MLQGTSTIRADDRIGWRSVEALVPFLKPAVSATPDKVRFRPEIQEIMTAAAALRARDEQREAERAAAAAREQAELARAVEEIALTATTLRETEAAELPAGTAVAIDTNFWSRHRPRILMWLAIGVLWTLIGTTMVSLGGAFVALIR
jgi:hypothetical protein